MNTPVRPILIVLSFGIIYPALAYAGTVTFSDAQLDAVIRVAIGIYDGPIEESDLAGLTTLDASSKNIQDLSGLRYCVNLTSLNLANNRITTFAELEPLSCLVDLNVSRNRLVTLDSLPSLPVLATLDISHTMLGDLTSLSRFPLLDSLDVSENQISDIQPLSGLQNLTYVRMAENQVVDIGVFAQLQNIQRLDITDNLITDLLPLGGTSLSSLMLSGNPISEFSPIVNMNGLIGLFSTALTCDTLDELQSPYLFHDALGCTPDGCLFGDFTRDGRVDALDIEKALRIAVMLDPEPDLCRAQMDLNADGRVDSAEAVLVARALYHSILNPPTSLSARDGAKEVLLTWLPPMGTPNSVSELAGYDVYRSDDGVLFNLVNASIVREPKFRDQSVESGHRYYYRVKTVEGVAQKSILVKSIPSEVVEAFPGAIKVTIPEVSGNPGDIVRIPINAANAGGVSPAGMAFWLQYDAAVAEYVRVERTAVTASIDFLANESASGLVKISSLSPSGGLLGQGHLFDVFLRIKAEAPQGCTDLVLNKTILADADGGVLPFDASDTGSLCVRPTCHSGDLDDDGDISVLDALAALKVSVGLQNIETCKVDATDMNGDGVVDSADAVMILRASVDEPLNPPQPGKTHSQGGVFHKPTIRDKARPERTLEIPNVTVPMGSSVVVTVKISDGSEMTGFGATIYYPSSGLRCAEIRTPGGTKDFQRQVSIEDGAAYISMGSAYPLPQGECTLFEMQFEVTADTPTSSVFPPLPVKVENATIKGRYGESLEWYSALQVVNGSVTVTSAAGDGEGEGEGETSEGEGEGETQTPPAGCFGG